MAKGHKNIGQSVNTQDSVDRVRKVQDMVFKRMTEHEIWNAKIQSDRVQNAIVYNEYLKDDNLEDILKGYNAMLDNLFTKYGIQHEHKYSNGNIGEQEAIDSAIFDLAVYRRFKEIRERVEAFHKHQNDFFK